jgi:hypothetical protein
MCVSSSAMTTIDAASSPPSVLPVRGERPSEYAPAPCARDELLDGIDFGRDSAGHVVPIDRCQSGGTSWKDLVVSDDHEGLKQAVIQVLPGQRCHPKLCDWVVRSPMVGHA